jgi:neutral ceramidase
MGAHRLRTCLLALLCLAAAGRVRALSLEAGVARADITPPIGLHMQGYPDPDSKRVATGVRDPLYARVLVLRVGEVRLAIVDLDLIAVFRPASLAQLREATRQDVSNLVVAAIHTHSGPPVFRSDSAKPEAWETSALDKIAGAVHEAASHLVPAKLGIGYGECQIGHNRLRIERDGSVTWFEKDWTGTPTAPVDPTVAVLRVDDMGGRPLAVLVNYACHPVIYAPDNRLYSADFPGVMTGVVEKAVGGSAICFFLQGGAGDINPNYAVSSLPQGAEEFCRRTGEELGRVAGGVAAKIQTVECPDPSLQVAEDTMTIGSRWDAALWKAADPGSADRIDSMTKPAYELKVTTVLIDKSIAILAVPGEPFVNFQLDWRARCPVHDCLFMGYSDGYFGYFPTIRAAAWGGYGASFPSTWVEVGAGEQLVDHGVARVYEMIGRLKPIPEDLQE